MDGYQNKYELSEKKPTKMEYVLYDLIYIKY